MRLEVQRTLHRERMARLAKKGAESFHDDESDEFGDEHAEEMAEASRTQDYDREFRHYYGQGEAGGFYRGGRLPPDDHVEPAGRYADGGEVKRSEMLEPGGLHGKAEHRNFMFGFKRAMRQRGERPTRENINEAFRQSSAREDNYARGGEVDGPESFARHLTKRKSARRMMRSF